MNQQTIRFHTSMTTGKYCSIPLIAVYDADSLALETVYREYSTVKGAEIFLNTYPQDSEFCWRGIGGRVIIVMGTSRVF
jgi:hypothetical protein